jgi:kynureninase
VLSSQVALHGLDPEEAVVRLAPREGEAFLRTEDVCEAIREQGDRLALVMLPGVQYLSGQLFDICRITEAAHSVGALAGWDCAHAAGNVPLSLHDWRVDFASWCSYKYLNAGPGGIAGAFVHESHTAREGSGAALRGWWGHRASDRFLMSEEHVAERGAAAFALSNPPVLLMACLRASLDVFEAAGGMQQLAAKSQALTGYLEVLLRTRCAHFCTILTPADPAQRGAQLSLALSMPDRAALQSVQHALAREGVIVDTREPNVMRVAPAPLYNSFEDVRQFVLTLMHVMREHTHNKLTNTCYLLRGARVRAGGAREGPRAHRAGGGL